MPFHAGESDLLRTAAAANCPFCAGHEQQTPQSLQEICDAAGRWQVRVVPNKFPAVNISQAAPDSNKSKSPFSESQPAYGAHEVIIESPDHVSDITSLSVDNLAIVLRLYRDRLQSWSSDDRLRYGAVFKNVGSAAGASLEHVHSQMIALPFVPPVMAEELRCSKRFYESHHSCVFCQLIDRERQQQLRWVAEAETFVAFCAYAGRQPFETWILPTEHAGSYQSLTDGQSLELAALLRGILSRLQTHLTPLSYNLLLHTAPFGDFEQTGYHWHLEIVPQSTQLAGFEWGTGVSINSLAPERAADLLREAKV